MNRIRLIRSQLLSNNKEEGIVTVESSKNNNQIKIVKLNKPKQLNALSSDLINALYTTLIKLDTDEVTKVVILTGVGKAFAAGADIKKFHVSDYTYMAKNDWDLLPIENIYYHMQKPIIAAVNGHALGGGLELALSCDLILASDKASLALPESKLGLIPGAGGTQRLVRLMGYHKAMEHILTTNPISLTDAKNFGVINDIVPADELLNKAHQLALEISKHSLTTIIASKKAMKLAMETNLFAGLKAEKYIFQGLFNTEDKKHGIDSFLNKKQPQFIDK